MHLYYNIFCVFFFFSSRRRHTRCSRDWSSDVCSSDLDNPKNIIQTLLNKYTRYTLLPHLPLDFEVISFDTYIEFQTNPTTNNSYLNRTPEEALGTLGSPIPNQYQSSLDYFEFSSIASENLIDQDQ